MERVVNDRLVWYLESNGLISNLQYGFRNKRSITDHLICLEITREVFIRKEHLTAIFFDLEKAYDTKWKYEIMRDQHDLGLKGRLPHFISGFLLNWKFKIRIGSTFLRVKNQEEGVPQGNVLSVTLFSIKINSIFQMLISRSGRMFIRWRPLNMLQVEIFTNHWPQTPTVIRQNQQMGNRKWV